MSEDIEGAIGYLESTENADVSVLHHVGETIVNIVDFGADRPIDYFEPFSYMLKERRQPERDPLLSLHDVQGPNFILAREALSRMRVNLFPKQKLTAEGEEEEEDQPENEGDGEGEPDNDYNNNK